MTKAKKLEVNSFDLCFMETFFFTSVVANRKPIFIDEHPEFIEVIVSSLKYFIEKTPFHLHALSIMPNHVHILYSQQNASVNFIYRFLKFTTHEILKVNDGQTKELKIDFLSGYKDRINQVWRPRSKQIFIADSKSYFAAKRYIQTNHRNEFWGKTTIEQSFLGLVLTQRKWT